MAPSTDPFATAALFKEAFGLEELSRGESDIARGVYLTDVHINGAIVCWKGTPDNPEPYPEWYGLDLAKMGGRIFFERKLQPGRGQGRSLRRGMVDGAGGCRSRGLTPRVPVMKPPAVRLRAAAGSPVSDASG